MNKKEESLVRTFLEMPDGRKRAVELGLEEMFDKIIASIKNRYPKVSFAEASMLGLAQLANQRIFTLEEKREQADRLAKGAEKHFALEAPEVQEELKQITTPLSFEYTVAICRWLYRKQITMEMIPKDVLTEFKKTRHYEEIMIRLKENDKG